jgi:hypothetical protein
MKTNVHPILSYTSIRRKDGSFEIKYWSYLRSSLILDVSSKKFNSQNLNTIVYSNVFPLATKTVSPVEVVEVIKEGVAFWQK